MDAQVLVQATILVRAGIDAIRAVLGAAPRQKASPDVIPVYRLVTRDERMIARSTLTADITGMRWPR